MKKRLFSALLTFAFLAGLFCSSGNTALFASAAADGNTTELRDLNYEVIYRDVLDGFAALIKNGSDWDDVMDGGTGVLEAITWLDSSEALRNIGFAIRDLSGDGIPELIIGDILEELDDCCIGKYIYSIYSCSEGVPFCVVEGWARNTYSLMCDGNLYNQGSNGAMYSIFGTYALSEDGSSLECLDYYFTYEKNSNFDIGFYYNYTGEWDKSVSTELDMTAEEFDQIRTALMDQVQDIELTSFADYVNKRTQAVKVMWAEDAGLKLGQYDEFVADEISAQTWIVFAAKETVTDFRILSLDFEDVTEDGKILFRTETIYSRDALEPDRMLSVGMSFFGAIPNYGISYSDSEGNTHQYSVSISGKDGSLILTEF